MKATIKQGDSQSELILNPENDEDKKALHLFALLLNRPHMVSGRGFGYLESAVSFIIQPMPRGD